MKTRHGLVSNSSTSSFCIYGCSISEEWNAYNNPDAFVRFLKKLKQEFPGDYKTALEDIKEKYKDKDYYDKQIEVAETIDEIKITDGPKLLLDEDDGDYCELELIHVILKYFDLALFGSDYSGNYIGRSWKRIKDDETGAQFKMKVDEVVKSLFNEECSTLEYSWND